MMYPEDKVAAELIAEKIGVTIPGNISIDIWMLPLLEGLLKRIHELEVIVMRFDNPEQAAEWRKTHGH